MRLIIVGAPGSGKGTLAGCIKSKYGYTHVSTGDILRENIKLETPIGLLAKPLLQEGKFVPDEMIIEIVKNKLLELKDDYVLDGFPRTLNQGIVLSADTEIDKVIFLDINYDVILKRLTNRRNCINPECKAIYNLNSYNKDTCEICGAPLFQRDDDKEEVISHRYEVYKLETAPLVDFYTAKGLLVRIDASGTPDQTFEEFKKLVIGE